MILLLWTTLYVERTDKLSFPPITGFRHNCPKEAAPDFHAQPVKERKGLGVHTLSTMKENQLLAGLTQRDRASITASLEPAKLVLGEHLEAPRTPFPYMYFVDIGIVSVVAVNTRRERAEVGLIGNEGVTGISALLGPDSSPNEVMVQGEGTAHRIGVAQLRASMHASATLRQYLHRYIHVFLTQASHTALANAVGRLEERLARWLLMAHDRLAGDGLALTHEFLSIMLAVRRSGRDGGDP